MSGSKVESWKVERLGDVCDIYNGGTPDTKVAKFWGGDILWITPKDMGQLESIYVDDTSRKITNEGLKNSSAKILPPNSVILSSRAPIGHLAINTKEITTNQGCRGLVPKKGLSTLYLYYFLENSVDLLNSLGTGTTFKELSAGKLAEIEIPLPPLPEQERIVSLLDESFAALAQVHANAARNLVNAREVFEAVQKEIFSNGKDWEETTIGKVAENLDSRRVPVTKRDRKEGKYPYYGASGIVDYVDKFIFEEDLLLVSEDGANLLARTYPIAFSISGKTWVNNHAHVLRFEKMGTQKFIEYYLNSIPLDEYVSGMAQPKLNQAMLNSIPVHLPPLAEQRAIVQRLDGLARETRRLEEVYRQKVEDVEELRKSVLQKAFEGLL